MLELLKSLWMNQTFAGPSEKIDHEMEFEDWASGHGPGGCVHTGIMLVH